MSNAKTGRDEHEEKENRSLYLAEKHWDALRKIGNGSPTKAIRKMIEERYKKEEGKE